MIDINKLTSMNSVLDEKYGKEGTSSRAEFNAKAQAWYLAEVLREERKKRNISQTQLAALMGKSRNFVTALEKDQTDMQLSTFLMVSRALNLNFSLIMG